eukprot:TRINITY_DN542_c0_g2_i4.p1 TRINITY_DN542_c0_g2~~TRINITY_DN542_c0_g2_i4.p1  ORF type:complete len:725 (+),score=160.46 TRINITY_DN542_c0_g2_i4:163-2337(+)
MCIRDRYQRRVRGTTSQTEMEREAMHIVQPAGVLLALTTVGWFHRRIDQWAVSQLQPAASRDPLDAQIRLANLRSQNQHARLVWASVMIGVCAGIVNVCDNAIDPLLAAWAILVLPFTLVAHQRLGQSWVPFLAQQTWTATALLLHRSSGPGPYVPFVMAHLAWAEISSHSLSMLLLNHGLTNVLAISACPHHSAYCHLFSLLMITLFCYRRSRPLEDADELPQNLSTLTVKCAELVRVVLESGDELCQAHTDTLDQLLGLLTGLTSESFKLSAVLPPLHPEYTPGEASSGSCFAQGAGTGQEAQRSEHLPSIRSRFDSAPDAACGEERDPGLSVLSAFAVAAPRTGTSKHVNFGSLPAPGAVLPKPPTKRPRAADLERFQEPVRAWPAQEAVQQQQQQQQQQEQKQQQQPREDSEGERAERLVWMSFDAMAQVELSTGVVLWANASFEELTSLVGEGHQGLGLQCLHGHFLQSVPRELQCRHGSFNACSSSFNLWSATQICGQPGHERVLWVIHRPLPCDLPGAAYQGPPPINTPAEHAPPRGGREQRETPYEVTWGSKERHDQERCTEMGYPAASDHPDPQTKVLSGSEHTNAGRGRRPTLSLWHKYGKKTVQSCDEERCVLCVLCVLLLLLLLCMLRGVLCVLCMLRGVLCVLCVLRSGGSQEMQVFERVYFKCFKRECKARLRVDCLAKTGERVGLIASGACLCAGGGSCVQGCTITTWK